MLEQVMRSNQAQVDAIVERIAAFGASRVGLFGLAFKDGTDDLRESPMLTMFTELRSRGMEVTIFDPLVDLATLNNVALRPPRSEELAARMTDDAAGLVGSSDLVVIARRKVGIDFASLPWPDDVRVLDLVGVDLPLDSRRIFGLYW
jgi:GDP-mannose 6-dehydrogenase